MKIVELFEGKDLTSTIEKLVKEAGLTPTNVKRVTINNIYVEYVVDIAEEMNNLNDRGFSQIAQSKKFRALVKKEFGENNLRSKSVVGLVVNNKGRFVFQVKEEK